MKKITLALMCLFAVSVSFAQKQQVKRTCDAAEFLKKKMAKNPNILNRMNRMESFTHAKIREVSKYDSRVSNGIYQIPVVVHVLHTNATNNINLAQIQSQLDVLNADFRRTNADRTNKWAQAADTQIEFKLATINPNGDPTTGITRTRVATSTWLTGQDNMKRAADGGVDPWDTTEYLNMWIVDNIERPSGGTILGYAQFPWDDDLATDGVVMADQYFGTSGTALAPFDGGRTATHEVGHYFGLRHIWGDGGCGVDDFVADTPESDASNYGCKVNHVSCGSEDMVQNYMDYSDDSCMNLFTLGQRNRMHTYLVAGGARRTLALSDKADDNIAPPICNNQVILTIKLDNYPEETSWVLKNDTGNTVASGKYSKSNADGSTVVKELCLPDDCYTFTIKDSQGDGICCQYGNGNYTLTGADGIIKSGASFTASEATDFCVGSDNNVDTTAPSAPTSVTASNISKTALTLNWTASIDNVGVTKYDVYQGTIKIGSTVNTSVNITDLTAGTTYLFSVKAIDAAGNISTKSTIVNVATLSNSVSYCTYKGGTTYEWIDHVSYGGMTNTTGANSGYADFTAKVATVAQGSTSQIILSAGFRSTTYKEYWTVWIDFNKNGTFESSEKVVSGSATNKENISANITIPVSAQLGQTRMRVAMKDSSQHTSACGTFSYGEVEDYTVNITSSTTKESEAVRAAPLAKGNGLDLMIYPNPATNNVHVQLASKFDNMTYKIVNIIGITVQSGRLNTNTLNVSNLNTGIYILEIYDGQKSLRTKLLKK